MKKIITSILALLSFAAVQAQNWTLDKSHSKLDFTIVHLGISEQEGNFKTFSIKLTASKDDFSDAVIELTADVNSIDTDNATRDEHLRGSNYFNAAAFPSLTFKSKSFTKITDNKYKLTGDLTIKGITKTVDLEVTYIGSTINQKTQKKIAGFKITGKINRVDFGVGTSSAALSDEVTITANIEVIKD
ncbi:MAG TPA: YceI family protein [Cytophaga sp.]|jgi:polyisoprenoid-binding protein YceI|nr:YceI family protein [Cytophaga sp.]